MYICTCVLSSFLWKFKDKQTNELRKLPQFFLDLKLKQIIFVQDLLQTKGENLHVHCDFHYFEFIDSMCILDLV